MTIRSLTVALMSGVALAAVQLPAVAATDFIAKQAAGEASSSGLIGTKIQNSAGENIGDVNYLVLDASGNVTTVVIGVGGFLGVGEKNVGVPFKSVTRTDDSNGNPVFKLEASKEELANAPAYEWSEKGSAQKAADSTTGTVKEKTEGMTRADEPAPSSTGASTGTAGEAKPDATPPAKSE
ncbi:MAG: PRC-barrel domain-containing protein [Hyphomicrobiaceae bacterium]|jgi:sporulation protein YlmC with PRC-barrel domain|nr:PRC-barrel domain-containing protein [Hyphomicrobiaceae bacterium]